MSLLIATPMYGGQCLAAHFQSCLNLKEELIKGGMEHDWLVTTNESLIPRARNTSVSRFLATDYQKLLFIDADITFNPSDVAELWNASCDNGWGVVCGAYRMKTPESKLTIWKEGKLIDAAHTEPTTVDYAGTGFMMIDRAVFEALQKAHPEWQYEEGRVGECWAFYQDPIENGIHLSEDYFFCQRYRELGGEIWWLPQIQLGHWGLYEYRS